MNRRAFIAGALAAAGLSVAPKFGRAVPSARVNLDVARVLSDSQADRYRRWKAMHDWKMREMDEAFGRGMEEALWAC